MLCHAVEVRGQISPVTSLLLSCESQGSTQVGSDRCIYPLSRPMGPLLFFILTISKRGSTGALFSFYRWEGFLCGNAFWVPQYDWSKAGTCFCQCQVPACPFLPCSLSLKPSLPLTSLHHVLSHHSPPRSHHAWSDPQPSDSLLSRVWKHLRGGGGR